MGEAGILLCLRASPPPSMAPEGLTAGQASVPPSPPLVLGSGPLSRPDLPQAPRYHGAGKQQSWGVPLGPSSLRTYSGSHRPSSPSLTTSRAPAQDTRPQARRVPLPRGLRSR